MLTRQEMDALVGKTLIIRKFPHICLAAGDDALLLLQIAVKDESFIRKGQPIKYIVAHYPEFQGDKLVWGQGEYYDVWAYRENDGIPATAQALRDASLSLAGCKLSVAMLKLQRSFQPRRQRHQVRRGFYDRDPGGDLARKVYAGRRRRTHLG